MFVVNNNNLSFSTIFPYYKLFSSDRIRLPKLLSPTALIYNLNVHTKDIPRYYLITAYVLIA